MDKDLKDKKPLVSVIMSAYNADKYISKAIESIIDQTYHNWELIIIDDASSDSTADVIERYAKQDSRIKTGHINKNSGQAIARNIAIGKATGTHLAILDADDIALPNRLAVQIEYMTSHNDIELIGSAAELIDEGGNIIGKKVKPISDKNIRFPLLLQTQFITSSVCVKKDAVVSAKGFDTTYLYAEDYDLWSRLVTSGTKCANIASALIQFRIQSKSVTQIPKTQLIQEQNAFSVNMRNVSPYIDVSRERLINLVNFINNKNLSSARLLDALILYRQLVKNYISSAKCTTDEMLYVKKLYLIMLKHGVKTKIKKLLYIKTKKINVLLNI